MGNQKQSAFTDEDDYETVSDYGWCLNGMGHVVARVDGWVILLGRFLLEPAKGLYVVSVQTVEIVKGLPKVIYI